MRAFRQWLGSVALRFGLRQLTANRDSEWDDDEWLIIFNTVGVIRVA